MYEPDPRDPDPGAIVPRNDEEAEALAGTAPTTSAEYNIANKILQLTHQLNMAIQHAVVHEKLRVEADVASSDGMISVAGQRSWPRVLTVVYKRLGDGGRP